MMNEHNPNDHPLVFPIIRKEKKGASLAKVVIVIIILLALIWIIVSRADINADEKFSTGSIIWFVLGLFIILLINFFAQQYKFGGELTLNDNSIIIKTTNKSAEFLLKDISELKVKFDRSDFEVSAAKLLVLKFYVWLFGKAGGSGNIINFTHKADSYNIAIYIKSKEKADILKEWAVKHKAIIS